MMQELVRQRSFLFLQGPPGPFFAELAAELRARGHAIHRINLNGGDRADWPEGGVDYRGRSSRWPLFLDAYLREHAVTDVLLFGDCRPMHMAAHGIAKLRGIEIHVFEEGYIRPDWMTMEPDGVNGRSTLGRDPEWFLEQAKSLPPLPRNPPITASFRRRARDSYRYYHNVVVGRPRFIHYHSHRPGSIIVEGLGWLRRLALAKRRAHEATEALKSIESCPYFILPLQLSSDYQIRAHSPFSDMHSATEYVMESFARYAPPEMRLVIKAHPLDCSFTNWPRLIGRKARALGVADRVLHIDGGDLATLASRSSGMVCVNSTSGTLALAQGIPVIVLGDAVYDVAGVTHQGLLDAFWTTPVPPVPAIYDAFTRVLHARCLVRGGLASRSATNILVHSVVRRLLDNQVRALPSRRQRLRAA